MKILFLGDSITDAGRDRRNYHNMGGGYPFYASEMIEKAFPDTEFEFINMGISGHRSDQLFDRLTHDGVEFQPDIVSVLIGINDIWHRYGAEKIMTTDEQFSANLRAILTRLKTETNAKILLLCPYVLDHESKESFKPDLARFVPIIRAMADEFADAFVPLGEYFDEAMKTQPEPLYYSADGVHPNPNGSQFIAKHYFEAIAPMIRSLA